MANPFVPGTPEFIQYQLAHPEDAPPAPAHAPQPAPAEAPAAGTTAAIQAQLGAAAGQQPPQPVDLGGRFTVHTQPAAAPATGNVASAMGLPAAPMNAPQVFATPSAGTMDPNQRLMLGQGGGQPQQQGTAALPIPPLGVGGGPVRVIPGKRTPQSWATTQEQGVQLDPETRALQEQANALRAGAQGIDESAATDERYIREEAGEQNLRNTMGDQADRERRDKMRAYDLEKAQAKYDAAKVIDPNRLWENKSGFAKAMDLVGAVAGGILMGMGRTNTNQYLDRMEREASQDVQLQLRNLEQAGDDIKGLYGQWDREDQRLAAGQKARLENALTALDYQLSGVKGQQQQAAYMRARADLLERIHDKDVVLAKETQGKTVVQQHDVMTKPQVVGGGGGGRDWMRTVAALPQEKLKDFWAAYELNMKAPGATKDKAMAATVAQYNSQGGISLPGKEGGGPVAPGDPSLFIPGAFDGSGGYARTPKDAEELRNGITAANTMVRNLRRIQELRNESVLNRLSPSAKAELELLVSDNITKRKETEKLGVLAGPDLDIVKPFAGANALDIISPGADRQLSVAIQTIQNAANNKLRDYGVVPGAESNKGGQLQGRVTGTSAPVVAPGSTPFKKAGE